MIGGVPAPQNRSRTGEITVIVLAALLLVAGMIWIAGMQEEMETPESVGSSVSSGRRGALALYRWLERAGFDVAGHRNQVGIVEALTDCDGLRRARPRFSGIPFP